MATRTFATTALLSLALGPACGGSTSSDTSGEGSDATSEGDETAASDGVDPSDGSDGVDSSGGEAESESGSDSGEGSTGDPPPPACGGGDSDYPLEITSPKPVGDAPNGMDPEHRIYRAYPGIEYDVRVAAIGGNYPFAYALANAPAGMTIDATTGEIVWPDPQSDADDITVTVTDSSGAEVSETWSIAVSSAGFSFVDAVNGDSGGAGTLDDPWRTLADVYANGGPDGIVYFRGGEGATYTVEGMPIDNPETDEERIEFDESLQPVMWLAHPDDEIRPVIDFGYTGEGEGAIVPRIRLSGANIYIDGLETTRSWRMGFQVVRYGEHGSTFRRLHMHDTGPGVDGGNSAFIMYVRCDDCPSYGDVVMDSEFSAIDYGTGNCALKMYSLEKSLVADNVFHDTGNGTEAVVAIKDSISQFEVRENEFYDVGGLALGGNMATTMFQTFGEFRFNNVRAAGHGAMVLNQNGEMGLVRAYRNTLQGSIEVRWLDAEHGPIAFDRNVIVNDDGSEAPRPFFRYVEVTAPERITQDDDLTGAPADGVVDELGDLMGEFMRWLGTHGHQLAPCERG